MIQMPESQLGSVRMRPSQIQIDNDDQQLSTRRRNFLSPTFSQNLPLFRELQSRQVQNRQEQDFSNSVLTLTDDKVISCHAQLIKSLLFNLFMQAFFINYFCYMHWKYSHRFVLLQLWVQDLVTIFILIYYNYRKGDDCIWQLIETMFLFFFKIFIVFYYEVQTFKIYFITIMMLAVSSLLLMMKLIQKIKNPTKTSTELILQFLKTMCCLQLLLITLKWEDKLSWSWIQIFLLLWVFLVVCALLLFISLVSCVETLINIIKKKQQCHYFAGNIWILLMLIGFTLFPFLFLLRTSTYYENNQLISFTETAKYLVIITLFSLFLLIFTLCFYKQIKLYLKDVQGITENNDIEQQQTLQSPNQRQFNSPREPKKIEFVKLGMPLYLIKLSCTYFALFDKASFDFKKKQKSHSELESGRSGIQGSLFKEAVKKSIQQQKKPNGTSSLVIQKKEEIDLDIIKPAITDQIKPKNEETRTASKQEVDQEQINIKSFKSVKSEAESSINQEKCLVCYENQPNIVFVPCRHGGICQQCAEDMIQKNNECYLCRKPITQILKIQKNSQKQLEVQEASIIN